MKNEVLFYVSIFLRRSHYFLVIFLVGSAISLTLANILPPVYLSRATLLLESSQIPTALAAPTVSTGAIEELQIIEQRLMTRTNLLDIARSENVFSDISEL
ncbi:MAG: GumC family protein, partial [Paracoccaceae bacterium]